MTEQYRVELDEEYRRQSQGELQEKSQLQLQAKFTDVPPPEPRREQEDVNGLLDALTPGGPALELPKSRIATKGLVYRYRALRGGGSFKIRQVRPGWSRIWRVK